MKLATATSLESPPASAAAAEISDAALVERFRAGERRAFDELVRRYQKPLYYLALRYLRNEADAADITQKTFVRAFQALERLRGEASVRSWLYRIAINLSLNHIRDHRREQMSEGGDLGELQAEALTTAPLGASRVIQGQEAELVRQALQALPPKQRLVLELRIYDELSFREVAALAGCTENAAKVNFHHAVKRLRSLLGENAVLPEDAPVDGSA